MFCSISPQQRYENSNIQEQEAHHEFPSPAPLTPREQDLGKSVREGSSEANSPGPFLIITSGTKLQSVSTPLVPPCILSPSLKGTTAKERSTYCQLPSLRTALLASADRGHLHYPQVLQTFQSLFQLCSYYFTPSLQILTCSPARQW